MVCKHLHNGSSYKAPKKERTEAKKEFGIGARSLSPVISWFLSAKIEKHLFDV